MLNQINDIHEVFIYMYTILIYFLNYIFCCTCIKSLKVLTMKT